MEDIDKEIAEFKKELIREQNLSEFINKRIVFGVPYIFKENELNYFNLKRKLVEFFNVSYRNIFIVGSSKLGFSIAPNKLWKKIDEDSDIDVVIISNDLFEYYWKRILEFNSKSIPISKNERQISFLNYFFRGWLRPDKFPNSFDGYIKWFEYMNEISYKIEYGNRKIAVAVYKDDYHFMQYQHNNLSALKNKIMMEG